RAATLAELEKLNCGAVTFSFENRYQCTGGSFRWLEWNAIPADGMIYAVARDITERKRAEAELKLAKEDTEESNRSLMLLDQVNQALVTCGSLDELGRVVTEALVEKYGAYCARFWVKRPGDLCSECALAQ